MLDPLRRRAGAWSKVLADADDAMALLTLRDLGVFDALLDGPQALNSLAEITGAAPRRLRAFLDVVVSMGFLRRDDEDEPRFALHPVDAGLFAEPSARALLPSEDTETFFSRRGRAPQVVRSGIGLDVASAGGAVQETERREFLTYLDRHARAEASELAWILGEEPASHVVDLGCGAGTYTHALLSRWPDCTATLVDRPNAAGVVAEHLAEAELGGRAAFRGVDLLAGSWSEGLSPDLVLISNMLHNVGPEACVELIEGAAAALVPGGRLVLKDFTVQDDRLGPPGGLRFALLMALCSDGGDLYSCREIAGWCQAAGLEPEPPETLQCAPESFVLVARKPEA